MNRTLLNKPKVFLSHSKKDIEFIQKLCEDLRLCQIEPWLDSQEIRHGQPWLEAIFESGIPTCDAILVYLTESSIESPMVKKEIDSGIIKKLNDSHVVFLPYVSHEKLRSQLRYDIQSLQTLEWSKQNYSEMLPRVVAEIWHGYLDRVVSSVANDEKVRRLEAELELEKLKNNSIFDNQENVDFEFIWEKFKYTDIIEFIHKNDYGGDRIASYAFKVEIQTVISQLDKIDDWRSPLHSFNDFFEDIFRDSLPMDSDKAYLELEWMSLPDFISKLKMYGLIRISQRTKTRNGRTLVIQTEECLELTEKLFRFKYWLEYKGILPNEIKWEKSR